MPDCEPIGLGAFDGTSLRGNFFKANGAHRPAIVMTQGLTLLKEHYIDDTAKRLRAAGISALVYDHRGYGSSDGLPRHETNPSQQAEDYHVTVTAAMNQAGVDPSRIAIWGIGHSGGAAMIAAGDDPRVKVVVLHMPFTFGSLGAMGFPENILDTVWRDREAFVASAHPTTTYVRIWPDSLANALGRESHQTFLIGEDAWNFISGARQRSDAAGTPWENRMTLQSFYHVARAEPRDFISRISPRPLLYLAAAGDPLSGPLQVHKTVFAKEGENAEFVVLHPNHLATYFGDAFEANVTVQLEFLRRKLLDDVAGF